MKSYRPPDWDKYDEWYKQGCNEADKSLIEIFEAGADAMLEALYKEQGVRITKKTAMVTQPIFEKANGWLVFIPDGEEDEKND